MPCAKPEERATRDVVLPVVVGVCDLVLASVASVVITGADQRRLALQVNCQQAGDSFCPQHVLNLHDHEGTTMRR